MSRAMMDLKWAPVARDARAALELLGRPVADNCLPGEASPCGVDYRNHAAAYFATIMAVAEHQLGHLGPEFVCIAHEVHDHEYTELATSPECQLKHRH
jgi:hypothetical protein